MGYHGDGSLAHEGPLCCAEHKKKLRTEATARARLLGGVVARLAARLAGAFLHEPTFLSASPGRRMAPGASDPAVRVACMSSQKKRMPDSVSGLLACVLLRLAVFACCEEGHT